MHLELRKFFNISHIAGSSGTEVKFKLKWNQVQRNSTVNTNRMPWWLMVILRKDKIM